MAGVAVEQHVGSLVGPSRELRIIPQIALQEQVDGLFQCAVALFQVTSQAGVQLSPPVCIYQDQPVQVGAELLVGCNLSVREQDGRGGHLDFPGGFAGNGIKDRLPDGAASVKILQAFF